jgi:GxxExxY protein
MAELVYKEEAYQIIGACFDVYTTMGCGFLEPVYQECLEIEFNIRKVPFLTQRKLNLQYKGQPLKQVYITDFLCFNEIIVEIKAVSNLLDEHRAQLINYLNAAEIELGLLVNFGHYPKVQSERFINTRNRNEYANEKRSLSCDLHI